MALAAEDDTSAVRALADSVEAWGSESRYGRDRKAHHYSRGTVHMAGGRRADAAREFQAAIHSPTMGFTRVNYDLAQCMLQLGRPRDAISALQPALRSDLEASALYLTHTELHELSAQHAFDRAGVTDSAAVHYRAVVRAWHRADQEFVLRRDAAQRWLAQHKPLVASKAPPSHSRTSHCSDHESSYGLSKFILLSEICSLPCTR
jgi:predicted Zn-dependent protease